MKLVYISIVLKQLMWGLRLFDVSLRDGLQSMNKIYRFSEKKDLLHKIINKYNPEKIEVGSIVNTRVLPQMHDSLKLYNYCRELELKNCYLLTPNLYSVKKGIANNVNNFSLITSVSDEFQKKNINKSLNETKVELTKIYDELQKSNVNNIKLYISCVRECPISGQMDINFIIDEIEYYFNKYEGINELCLSDTCGTLTFTDFKIIIDKLCMFYDISITEKISLHLHKNKDMFHTYNIINYGYLSGINKFDVSCLDSGGCSVTIDSKNMNNNLHYDDFYELFNKNF